MGYTVYTHLTSRIECLDVYTGMTSPDHFPFTGKSQAWNLTMAHFFWRMDQKPHEISYNQVKSGKHPQVPVFPAICVWFPGEIYAFDLATSGSRASTISGASSFSFSRLRAAAEDEEWRRLTKPTGDPAVGPWWGRIFVRESRPPS